MIWKQYVIGIAFGVCIDIALVWLFYWFRGEQFAWAGFWIWQGILWGAGVLLWIRGLLGFSIWYAFHGRETLARNAFESFVSHNFDAFDPQWDNLESWMEGHLNSDPRSRNALEFASAWALARQTGLWQRVMMQSAHKKAAIRYGKALKRRESLPQLF